MIRRMDHGRTRFAAAVTFAFVAAGGLGMLCHEMWRDELQAWLLAAQSGSLPELFHNLRYEGHPALWHLLLFAVSRITGRITGALWAMQVLHLAIAASAVFLFARNAPFSRHARALFAFGYFPLFEYGVLSRSYSLGLLLVLAFASLYPVRLSGRYLPLGIVLALLANANAYGWLLAAVLTGGLAVEVLTRAEVRRDLRVREALLAAGIWGAGAALGVLQMLPPADGGFAGRGTLAWEPEKLLLTLSSVAYAYFPLPNVGGDAVWNSLLLWRLPPALSALLGAAAVTGLAVRLSRSRVAFVAYLTGTLALLVFTYVFYFGWLRHHGHHFILAIGCLWLARRDEGGEPNRGEPRRDLLPVLWLTVHLIAGLTLWGLDLALPFSNARAVARLLADVPLPVAAGPDYLGTPVSAYLGRPLYHLETQRPGTFVLWNQERARPLTAEDICGQLGRLAAADPRGALFVVAYPPPPCHLRMKVVASFQQSLAVDERYLVIHVLPPAGP
ncbi:MAG TPA: hypothetical protein VKM72_04335 [Thermoanaerobaculia bacterium]|nr:hypothetical protein [Thermoanaerobaculia bacterium]